MWTMKKTYPSGMDSRYYAKSMMMKKKYYYPKPAPGYHRPYVPPRPPYRKPVPPPSPPMARPPPPVFVAPVVVSTELEPGTSNDPFVNFSIIARGSRAYVDVFLPNLMPNQAENLYLVRSRDVEPGSPCPPRGGIGVSVRNRSFVRLPLSSLDSVVALCAGGSVVSQSYFL